jgi:hypothetical protein
MKKNCNSFVISYFNLQHFNLRTGGRNRGSFILTCHDVIKDKNRINVQTWRYTIMKGRIKYSFTPYSLSVHATKTLLCSHHNSYCISHYSLFHYAQNSAFGQSVSIYDVYWILIVKDPFSKLLTSPQPFVPHVPGRI